MAKGKWNGKFKFSVIEFYKISVRIQSTYPSRYQEIRDTV